MAVNPHKNSKQSSKLKGEERQDTKGTGEQNGLLVKGLVFVKKGYGPTDYRSRMITRSCPFERSMTEGYDMKVISL